MGHARLRSEIVSCDAGRMVLTRPPSIDITIDATNIKSNMVDSEIVKDSTNLLRWATLCVIIEEIA